MEPWTHHKAGRFIDPMNLRFQGSAVDADLVAKDLDSVRRGGTLPWDEWHDPVAAEFATVQYVLRAGNSIRDDRQRVAGFVLGRRFHIRLWDDPQGGAQGSAHYEKWAIWTHKVLSFEQAEQEVVAGLQSVGWAASDSSRDLRNATDFPENDGYASIVRK